MPTEQTTETFCQYLARQLIVKKEYSQNIVPEAAALVGAADIVLSRHDGMTLTMLCLIDRETNPTKQFSLSPQQVQEVAQACLKYSGKVNRTQMPVTVQIIEVSAAAPTETDCSRLREYKRKTLFSKAVLSAAILDTKQKSVWMNNAFQRWIFKQSFIYKQLLAYGTNEPQFQDKQEVAIGNPRTPLLTYSLLALLALPYILELTNNLGPIQGLGSPSLQTSIAFGALNKQLVLNNHEWYRLLTAVFLHGSIIHIVMNGFALYMVGALLENLIGRLWLLAVFILGGVGGSLMSLVINNDSVVSVGASGAILALFTTAYICSFRLPLTAGRTPIQMQLVQVIIPALIPIFAMRNGAHIDYGAHLGGALSGVFLGLVLLKSWPTSEVYPRIRVAAGVIVIVGTMAILASSFAAYRSYPNYNVLLIPSEQFPKSQSEAMNKADELVRDFPGDPRSHWLRASKLLATDNIADSEIELRTALTKWEPTKLVLQPKLKIIIAEQLAQLLVREKRMDEARNIADVYGLTDWQPQQTQDATNTENEPAQP